MSYTNLLKLVECNLMIIFNLYVPYQGEEIVGRIEVLIHGMGGLEGMHGADLRKKLSRLAAFNQHNKQSQVDETLRAKAQQFADVNPRLL